MTVPRFVRTVLFGFGALFVFGGANCPHLSDPWQPTMNRGDCVPLPEDPVAFGGDESCAGRDTAAEAEPNGSLFQSAPIDERACSGAAVISGGLSTPNDVDLFAVPRCKLPFLSSLNVTSRDTKLPTVAIKNADEGTEVCLFAYCALGPTSLGGTTPDGHQRSECPIAGTIPAHLEEGMLGCCRRGDGALVTQVVCDSYQVEVSGLIAVRSVSSACHAQPYELTFSIAPPPGS